MEGESLQGDPTIILCNRGTDYHQLGIGLSVPFSLKKTEPEKDANLIERLLSADIPYHCDGHYANGRWSGNAVRLSAPPITGERRFIIGGCDERGEQYDLVLRVPGLLLPGETLAFIFNDGHLPDGWKVRKSETRPDKRLGTLEMAVINSIAPGFREGFRWAEEYLANGRRGRNGVTQASENETTIPIRPGDGILLTRETDWRPPAVRPRAVLEIYT